jgi:hypothetical protein
MTHAAGPEIEDTDATLPMAADRYFGSWDDALQAAGFDPGQYRRQRPTWTRDTILLAIRDIQGKGGPLHASGVTVHSLLSAAIRLFGSWDAALLYADIDPQTVRRTRAPWTRSEFVAELRRQYAAGQPVNAKAAASRGIHQPGCHLFGSWDAALQAARIDPATVRGKRAWTPADVIQEIRRHRVGEPLHAAAISPTGLRVSGIRFFGSWDRVLTAAGLDPAGIRRYRKPFTAATIIEELHRKKSAGDPLNSSDVTPSALHASARRIFGSWDAALEAAGIDPQEVRLNPKAWTAEALVEKMQQRFHAASASEGRISFPVPVRQAARRLFGSWPAAITAAGLDPNRVHVNRRPWTKQQILELIRSRAADGLPLIAYRTEPRSVVPAARRLYGSWSQALKAAGVAVPMRGHRRWTEVSIVEAILARQMAGKPLHSTAVKEQCKGMHVAACRCFGS